MSQHDLLAAPFNAPLSVGAAKTALLGGVQQAPVTSVAQAKEAILGGVNIPVTQSLTVAESKALLLGSVDKSVQLNNNKLDKQTRQGKLPSTGPSLNGIPYLLLDPVGKAQSLKVEQERKQVILQQEAIATANEENALLSNDALNTSAGAVANIGISAVSGAVDVGTGILSTVTKGLNFAGLDDDTAATINIGLDAWSAAADKLVNKSNQTEAIEDVRDKSEQAAEEFKRGDIFTGIGTILSSQAYLAREHPAAALEFTANSLPQMFVLARSAIIGIGALTSTGYDDAIEEFIVEHGRQPDNSEKALAGFLSLTSAGLDKLGADSVLGIKKIVKLATKSGITAAKETITKADSVFKKLGKGILATPKAVVVESVTEGTQNLLTQQAGKQDTSKLDPVEAITDATIGGVAGGHLRAPSAAVQSAAAIAPKIKETINKAANVVVDKGRKAGIGKVDDVVATAKETDRVK